MQAMLFHSDNSSFFNLYSLREQTAKIVRGSSLIQRAHLGERAAAIALKTGFWPFVREFELAIDQQCLPRQPLTACFGDQRVRRVFTGIARALRDMKQEEGSHAAHWRKDARCLGVDLDEQSRNYESGVRALIDRSYIKDLPCFFATLAGTEYIAEELSRFLLGSQKFTDLFDRKRWIWGEVHIAPHEAGPSHLEIDLDLARTYGANLNANDIEQMVLETAALFGRAANDVADALLPESIAA